MATRKHQETIRTLTSVRRHLEALGELNRWQQDLLVATLAEVEKLLTQHKASRQGTPRRPVPKRRRKRASKH